MKFCFKCNDAAHLCDKHQYNENGFFDRLMMKIHLFLCKRCRHYSQKNKKLTDSITSAKIKTLNPEDKNALRNRLSGELNKLSEK